LVEFVPKVLVEEVYWDGFEDIESCSVHI